MLAQLWTAEGIEAVLELLSRSTVAREHEVIHELHAQAVECERTAPEVSAQLDRVAGQLTEIHAGLRAAEAIESLEALLIWQVQAAWRLSAAMQGLLAAVAASTEPGAWPWRLQRMPGLQAELDRLLHGARELTALPASERQPRIEREPRLRWPALLQWLAARAGRGDAEAPSFARLLEHVRSWQRTSTTVGSGSGSGSVRVGMGAGGELVPLTELLELWYRLDPELDRTCRTLTAEVSAGQRTLADALHMVGAGSDEPERALQRRVYLLFHLLEDPAPAVRRAALVACTRLVASLEAQSLAPVARGTLVLRFAVALELGWRVLPDPAAAFEGALRLVDQVLHRVEDGLGEGPSTSTRGPTEAASSRLACDLVVLRARLLRRLVGWRDAVLEQAVQAHEQALRALDARSVPHLRGRVLGELAGLRRARRGDEPEAQDRQVRALYEEALDELRDAVVLRARVQADYATYLAQPLESAAADAERALALAHEAVAQLEGLPTAAREHPLLRAEEVAHRLTLGNVRLEVGGGTPSERGAAALDEHHRALERLGGSDELLAGLLHLAVALVLLASSSRDRPDDRLSRARDELEAAVQGLGPLPVAHGRAIAERAMLAMRAAPDDEPLRERCIAELEAALQRLPLGSDRVVRARVQRQLGELYLHRDGPDDLQRAAEQFAAARVAFVEGGAVRLAVEVARDYAECQLRQHADDGDAGALTRGAVVLEQAALLAEQRWAGRRPDEPLDELTAMLDGVHGDLAWLLARLGRPAEVVLRTVTRAKRHRAHPSLRALQTRAERSSLLSPAYLDPLARRLPPALAGRRGAVSPGATSAELRRRVLAFAAANPSALAVDLTLTRWGTVAVAAWGQGGTEGERLAYVTVPLSRETVRRWVWGEPAEPGWWAHALAHREALREGHAQRARACERAWTEAGGRLAAELGARLLDPVASGLGVSLAGRVVLLAPGRTSGLPFAAARVGGQPLVTRVQALAVIASLAELPAGPLPDPRPRRALCVLADPEGSAPDSATTVIPSVGAEELQDVVRLLASGQAEVEVLARLGAARGAAVHRPTQARTRARVVVSDEDPTVEVVLARVPRVEHLFHGGQGRGTGLLLVGRDGGPGEPLDAEALASGPRWAPHASVVVSAAARCPPPVDDAATWRLIQALHDAGVAVVVLALGSVPPILAREVTRGLYLYWALGRSLLEACTAALGNVAESEPARLGSFVVSLGAVAGRLQDEPKR